MKRLLSNLIIYGGHYFYALLILEPSLIHYCIAWFLLLKVFSKVVEHPSNLWLWIWWGTHSPCRVK